MTRAMTLLLVLACASPAHAQLGGLLRGAQKALQLRDIQITDDEEQQLGAAVSERIRARYGVVQDPSVHRYVALVGTVLALAGARPSLPYKFIVLDTDAVNAFATPGGYIHITRGALALIENEAELAGVLAHELVHTTHKHTIRAIQKSKAVQMGADEKLSGNPLLLDKLAEKTFDVVLAGFGRAEELEADHDGIAVASRVGYAPTGLRTFLLRLTERNTGATERRGLFASHPDMTARLAAMQSQIAGGKLPGAAVLADRYRKFISYTPTPQSAIATVEAGAAGLAGGAPAKDAKAADNAGTATAGAEKEEETPEDAPKRRGFGLGRLIRPGQGEEKKTAQVTGSGGARGVDPEVAATGGNNPALVAVTLTAADIAAFKKDGGLTK